MANEAKKFANVGGQAVIEGVMMRGSDSIATAVRTPSGEIVYQKVALTDKNKKWIKVPFVRGIITLFEALFIGTKALSFSAIQAGVEEESEKELSKGAVILTMAVSLIIGIAVFFLLPSFIGSFGKTALSQNILEGFVRIVLFVGYVYAISFLKDIQTVFRYHGAEHKTIYTYEAKKDLTVDNVRDFSTIHPRCGTSFIVTVLIISIFVFSLLDFTFIHTNHILVKNLSKFAIRICFLPVIASLAYEFQRFSSNHLGNVIIKFLAKPGLWVQKITTKEPTDLQIEVAIVALKVSLGETVENATEIIK